MDFDLICVSFDLFPERILFLVDRFFYSMLFDFQHELIHVHILLLRTDEAMLDAANLWLQSIAKSLTDVVHIQRQDSAGKVVCAV